MVDYFVNNIYPCIQGEGVNTGVPMVMLRLQECDVGCPFCDTKETWEVDKQFKVNSIEKALGQNPKYAHVPDTVIAEYIKNNYPTFQWILISGGEPAQQFLWPLASALKPYKIALETSGTAKFSCDFDWVCVSPKFQKLPIHLSVMNRADEIKAVIGKQKDLDKLDDLLKDCHLKPDCQICLQPISQSKKATELCIKTCQERGWRLSIQLHKYIGAQ